MSHRYLVVIGACLTQFMVIGLFFVYSLLIKELELSLGWSRTTLSIGASLAALTMGLFAIFAGRLSDRFGPRIVLTVAGLLYGLGFAAISLIEAPWQLFVICALPLGLGMATHDVVTLGAIARWFASKRGVMTGVAKTGTALGQVVLPPLAALLFVAYGWRDTVVMLGLAASFILVSAAQMMRGEPVAPTLKRNATPDAPMTFAQIKRNRALWTMCAAQFLFFPTLMTLPLHTAVHGMDLGMSPTMAAGLLSFLGASSVVGRLGIGALADRLGGRVAYALCLIPLIASLILLIFVEAHWLLFAVVTLYGFGHGGLFVVVAPTIAEFFGTKAHGAAFGIILFFGTMGGALGPILAGQIFDRTGSYALAFATLAIGATLALLLALTLPRGRRTVAAPLPS